MPDAVLSFSRTAGERIKQVAVTGTDLNSSGVSPTDSQKLAALCRQIVRFAEG
jgi:hypothetical protein